MSEPEARPPMAPEGIAAFWVSVEVPYRGSPDELGEWAMQRLSGALPLRVGTGSAHDGERWVVCCGFMSADKALPALEAVRQNESLAQDFDLDRMVIRLSHIQDTPRLFSPASGAQVPNEYFPKVSFGLDGRVNSWPYDPAPLTKEA